MKNGHELKITPAVNDNREYSTGVCGIAHSQSPMRKQPKKPTEGNTSPLAMPRNLLENDHN